MQRSNETQQLHRIRSEDINSSNGQQAFRLFWTQHLTFFSFSRCLCLMPDSNGWGFYGCGNTYRSGASSSFGQSYRSGDTITCKLDMDARTLAYEKNDQPLGVAFTELPESVHPAFSLYTKNDFIQIVEFGTF